MFKYIKMYWIAILYERINDANDCLKLNVDGSEYSLKIEN